MMKGPFATDATSVFLLMMAPNDGLWLKTYWTDEEVFLFKIEDAITLNVLFRTRWTMVFGAWLLNQKTAVG